MGSHSLETGMAENKLNQEERHRLIFLKNETKLVMEAFLQKILALDESAKVGHIGRYYHDTKKFVSKTPESQDSIPTVKSHVRRKSNQKATLEREAEEKKKSLKRSEGIEDDVDWDTTDEETSQAEEKPGFRTTIKRLIRRQRKKTDEVSDKMSRDSLDALEDHGSGKNANKVESKANSLKRPKNTNPLLACTVGSIESVTSIAKDDATEVSSKQSSKKKSNHQKFLNLFRKMSHGKSDSSSPGSEKDQGPSPSSPRPNTLPLIVHHVDVEGSTKHENVEFYSKVAKELDKLAQQYCAQTGNNHLTPTADGFDKKLSLHDSLERENNNVPQNVMTDKEKMIEKIVGLLQEQGDGINNKIKQDPLLQRTMSRMSYSSFTQLVKVFTANIEEQHEGPTTTSPELTKIALTMELTRRVAGISSHPVQQLMGYSMQYMDMFVPWLQENGGWKMVLPLDDVSEHQID
ncbi:apoptosis facilitator Bcl-2-like protein 14 [Heptranchias perlo]|uniref:apoptosis facilitator Bcl-2-like protein 14 n=1 Tax=Heptranchias perlo TaxID=212740 RepID=UPI00355952FC